MIQVLVVDDEVHCAEGVKSALDWKALGVTGVFTAYSMKQAQAVVQKENIDIVISDVEMPKGSGFELLRWLRDSHYELVVVMLTSYANFDYAKQAIEFHCMEYLLKPVSEDALLKTMRAAVSIVQEKRKNKESSRLAEYWNENERYLIRQFWREILDRKEMPDSETIARMARQRHIVYDEHNHYMPIVFKMHDRGGCRWNEELKYGLYDEVFEGESQTVLMYNTRLMLAIVSYALDFEAHIARLTANIKRFIRRQEEEQNVGISAYMGTFDEAGQVPVQYELLNKMALDNVAELIGVYNLHGVRNALTYERPDIEEWFQDFGQGDAGENLEHMAGKIDRYVDAAVVSRSMNKEILTRLLQDFMQVFYIVVNEKGIQAHRLFEDDTSGEMYEHATHSASEFKRFVRHLLKKALEYIHLVSDSDTVILRIKGYIRENLTKELSRELLAEEFFMSPDYISRIFRQKTGTKLMDYITDVRMKEARHLLGTTNLPIGEVAYASGYYNVAYFSRVFRIHNGETPAQYRQREKGYDGG